MYRKLPPLRLFRIKELEKEEKIVDRILVEKKEAQEDDFQGLLELFEGLEYGWHYEGVEELFGGLEYSKLSHFERKVQKVMKVYRVTSGTPQ